MKSLYESILDLNINDSTTELAARQKLCKDISKVMHKHFDQYTKRFGGKRFDGVEDGINQYGTGEWKTDWYKMEDSIGTSPEAGQAANVAKKFVTDLKKIKGIKLDIDEDNDLPDFYYAWIGILNFPINPKSSVEEMVAAYPTILFSFDNNLHDDNPTPNALIAAPEIFLKK